jgi:LacI family transcriptional regulator
MATLHEVAALSGYSVMTASRVMTGRGYTSSRARTAILAAADQLNYVPNDVARSLRSNRTGVLALIISDIENSFYATIAKTAEAATASGGFRLFIGSSNEDPVNELRLIKLARELRAEALLITPTAHNAKALKKLATENMPVVQLDRRVDTESCSSVLLDNEGGARSAIEYLVERGHRRIALISGPRELTTGEERVNGALRAAANSPHPVTLDVVEAASYLRADAIRSVTEALSRNPTAILAGNNVVAEACMEVFAEHGIKVPIDVSVLAFDDISWMRWMDPPLSCIRQPIEEMALDATTVALNAIAAETMPAPEHHRFPTELVLRNSVASV